MPDTPPVPRPEVVAWLRSGAERHERYVADGIEWSNEGNAHRLAALYRAALRDVEACAEMEDAEYRDRGVTITPEIAALIAPPGAEP
jgi:hypothetical protein